MHIEILPRLRACLSVDDKSCLCLDCLEVDSFVLQVFLRIDQADRLLRFDCANLLHPPVDVVEGCWHVGCHANHKDISIFVLEGSTSTHIVVTSRIMDLDEVLLLLDLLLTLVDIEHRRLVSVRVLVPQIVGDQC